MKLKEIKEFGGHPNDWLKESSDEEILRLVDEMIDYSGYLKPESTEGRPWGQPLKKPAGAPLNLG